MLSFESLGLHEPLLRALTTSGYTTPTPVQAQAIPVVLAGRDMIGVAQTGTGKTAAFALPLLQHLASQTVPGRPIRALILTPTRELAGQIHDNLVQYGAHLPLRHTVIFGGVGQMPQVAAIRRGVDVLVATPGRLLDLCSQGHIRLDQVTFFVLDEADRMLDMGFIHDIRRVLRMLPPKRQNLMFSATMPPVIAELANSFLHQPVRVDITPPSTTVERIQQSVMFVAKGDKPLLLTRLLRNEGMDRTIVFTRTKHGADKVVKVLLQQGISAAAIHGNKSQNARVRALDGFKSGEIGVLVATDVASRGLDIDAVSHVVNFDLPNEPESYVHRIGRTGRAGKDGIAVSFCDVDERPFLRDIERTTGATIDRVVEQPFHLAEAVLRPEPPRQTPAARAMGAPAPSQRTNPSGGQGGQSSGGGAAGPGGQARRRRRRRSGGGAQDGQSNSAPR